MEDYVVTRHGTLRAFTVPQVQALRELYGMAAALVKESSYKGEQDGYLVPTKSLANLNTALQRVNEKMKGAKLG